MSDSPPENSGIPPLDFTKEELEFAAESVRAPSVWITLYNCHFCGNGTIVPTRQCMACNQNFCKTHVSSTDLSLCFQCAAEPDRDPPAPQPFIEPTVSISALVDDEGVHHTGKLITPVGDTFVAARYIDSLDDEQLQAMLLEYKAKVAEAEKLLYSHTIVAGTVEMAISDRKRKKRIADHAARIVRTPQGKQIVMPGPRAPRQPVKVGLDAVKETIKAMSKEDKKALFMKIMSVMQSK